MNRTDSEVRELIQRARQGDCEALGELLERHLARLRVITRRHIEGKLAARVDASDLIQQTCLSAYRNFAKFEGTEEAEFMAWLGEVHERNIQNAIRDHTLTQKRAVSREERLGDGAAEVRVLPTTDQTTASQNSASVFQRDQETIESSAYVAFHSKRGKIHQANEQRFGRYRILKTLGKGGMGAVYLAEDPQLDRLVAIKVPIVGGDRHGSILDRFGREAKSVAAIQHPNICPIFDVGDVDGVPFIAMAYIEGKPLSKLIRADKPLPIRPALLLVRKLALALEQAHNSGIIHRDLKPDNIMINKLHEPIIMDFGLARRDGTADTNLTKAGDLMGTPQYMSPEQVRGDVEAMGPPCDIYSLGVILYQLLSGRVPFRGDMLAVLSQIANEEPKPPSTHRGEIDQQLDHICMKAMSKKIEDRFRSMGEFAKDLTAYIKAQGSQKTSPVEETEQAKNQPEILFAELVPGEHEATPVTAKLAQVEPPQQVPYPQSQPPQPQLRTHPRARLRSARTTPLRRWAAVASGLSALLLVIYGVIILLNTKYGAVKIEIDDPNVTVFIDGEEANIESWGDPIRLTIGEHTLIVKQGDVLVDAKRFDIGNGKNSPLKIRLLPPRTPLQDGPSGLVKTYPASLPGVRTCRVRFSPDGKHLLATGIRGKNGPRVVYRDVVSGKAVQRLEAPTERITSFAVSPDGTKALTAGSGGFVRYWDLKTGNKLLVLPHRGSWPTSVAFSADGKRAVVGIHGRIRTWDLTTGESIGLFHPVVGGEGGRVLFTRSGELAVVTNLDEQSYHVWQVAAKRKVSSLQSSEHVLVTVSGKHMLGADSDGVLWSLRDGQEIGRLQSHGMLTVEVAISPDGRTALTGRGVPRGKKKNANEQRLSTGDFSIRLWDVSTGHEIDRWEGHNTNVTGIDYSPDGRFAASIDDSGTICIWRLPNPNGEPIFNGNDLSDWMVLESVVDSDAIGEPASEDITLSKRSDTDGWQPRDGVLICEGVENRNLAFDEVLDDFEVSMEIRLPPEPYSGFFQVVFRVNLSDGTEGRVVDIPLQTHLHDANGNNSITTPTWKSGGLHAIVAPSAPAMLPQGQWNTLQIRCEGDRVQITLNGIQTVDTNLKEILPPEVILPKSGLFGFFGYTNSKDVQIRNIRLRKLTQ